MSYALCVKNANFSANKLAMIEFDDTIQCTGLTLSSAALNFMSFSAQTLTAVTAPADTTDAVSWTTSNAMVATVADGVVTPTGLGQATITATCGNYSASCAVTVDDVVPDYTAVAGYNPVRRSTTGSAATTQKDSYSQIFVLADNKSSGLYPIESKADVDTSPYRFVPIKIPHGATKITITSTGGNIRSRSLYFDSTKVDAVVNIGAYCVYGAKDGYDQESRSASELVLEIPTGISGLDSCAFAVLTGNEHTKFEEYKDELSIRFSLD